MSAVRRNGRRGCVRKDHCFPFAAALGSRRSAYHLAQLDLPRHKVNHFVAVLRNRLFITFSRQNRRGIAWHASSKQPQPSNVSVTCWKLRGGCVRKEVRSFCESKTLLVCVVTFICGSRPPPVLGAAVIIRHSLLCHTRSWHNSRH